MFVVRGYIFLEIHGQIEKIAITGNDIRVNSWEEAHKGFQSRGFDRYMFTLLEVK